MAELDLWLDQKEDLLAAMSPAQRDMLVQMRATLAPILGVEHDDRVLVRYSFKLLQVMV